MPGRIKADNGPGGSENPFDVLATRDTQTPVSVLPEVPITSERRPFRQPDDDIRLNELGIARANLAATYEHPEGSTQAEWSSKHKNQTVLQQHLNFFDTDNDGVVWPQDTFWAFMKLRFGIILSIVAVFIIHPPFSWPTNPKTGLFGGWLPDPFFRIHSANIHKTKHGSDSGTYDTEGRFISQKFEDLFSKYASGKDYMTWDDVKSMMKGQRLLIDPFGWSAAFLEWGATYYMIWPADGKMSKEDARGVFDGTLFYRINEQRIERKERMYKIF